MVDVGVASVQIMTAPNSGHDCEFKLSHFLPYDRYVEEGSRTKYVVRVSNLHY